MNKTARPQMLGPVPGPTLAEMETGLRAWAAERPGRMQVETVGHSPKGLPVLLCRITDETVPDADKQVALITTTHSGIERITVVSVLLLIKWLLGDDAAAQEIRRRQIVLIMPSCEPETYDQKGTDVGAFFGNRSRWVYEGWTWDGPQDPDNQPEAMAIKQVEDTYQPEMVQDVHGHWFEKSTMAESTGDSWASNLYRSYAPGMRRQMNEAAEAAGYLIAGAEEPAGQILSAAPVPGAERWFYGSGSPLKIVAGLYPYVQFHSLVQTMEVGWEESGFLRLRRMLELGNATWKYEPRAGYPANQVSCWESSALAAWGATAAERRKSRVELWRKLPQLSHACAWPEPRDSMVVMVATTPEARARYVPGGPTFGPGKDEPNLKTVFARLAQDLRFNTAALDAFLRRTTAEYMVWPVPQYDGPVEPIQNGMAIRLLLQFPDLKFTHLALDGYDLRPSETDGYMVYHNPGTIVQVNIPPGKVQDFHVITALFETDTKRRSGFLPEDWRLNP